MFPSLPAARQDFTDAELQALLRQPPAHYQPLPTDPLHDPGKPPQPGALAWLLSHEMAPADLQGDMQLWIESAEGRIDHDPGLRQAWAHARRHAPDVAARATLPCFAAPGQREPKQLSQPSQHRASPVPVPAPSAQRPVRQVVEMFADPPAISMPDRVSPAEKLLTRMRMSLAQLFMQTLGMHRPPAGTNPRDIDRLLRQGVALAFVFDLPLGDQVPHQIREETVTAGIATSQNLFGQDTASLQAIFRTLGMVFLETLNKVKTDCPRQPEFTMALAAFRQYMDECLERIGRIGRHSDPGHRRSRSGVEAGA